MKKVVELENRSMLGRDSKKGWQQEGSEYAIKGPREGSL